MQMRPVTSSNISAIGYDAAAHILAVQFGKTGTYHFEGVPEEVDAAFRELEESGGSVGKFFAANVKGRFPSTRQING